MSKKRLGIIQSRGLGDLVIALPIARYYHDQGYLVHWPIAEQFMSSMTQAAPWVKWIPLTVDHGAYFYETPMERLRNFKCDEIICLYQSLSSMPELQARPEFQITKFDQIKYYEAGVPFTHKWRLSECITRNPEREQALKSLVLGDYTGAYCVLHLDGSDHRAEFDLSAIPPEYRVIEVRDQTDSIFDWLGLLESAEVIVCVDSVMANIVDQMLINQTVDSYFIPRSHIQLTPVLNGPWTFVDPGEQVKQRIRVFR